MSDNQLAAKAAQLRAMKVVTSQLTAKLDEQSAVDEAMHNAKVAVMQAAEQEGADIVEAVTVMWASFYDGERPLFEGAVQIDIILALVEVSKLVRQHGYTWQDGAYRNGVESLTARQVRGRVMKMLEGKEETE